MPDTAASTATAQADAQRAFRAELADTLDQHAVDMMHETEPPDGNLINTRGVAMMQAATELRRANETLP
jgi:hypothetical protein